VSRCSHCGTEVEPGASVCPECGLAIASTASFRSVECDVDNTTEPIEAVEGPVLIVRKGPQPGENFYLDRPRLTVGRDPSSDIFLNDMTVSRDHAVLELENGDVTVRDEKSLNGTYVNGVCVDEAVLNDGDVLQIGTFQMVYHCGCDAS
jgi:hypothetical protein